MYGSRNQRACFFTDKGYQLSKRNNNGVYRSRRQLVQYWDPEHYSRSRGTARKSTRKPAEALAVSWCRAPDAPVARSFLNVAVIIRFLPVLFTAIIPIVFFTRTRILSISGFSDIL